MSTKGAVKVDFLRQGNFPVLEPGLEHRNPRFDHPPKTMVGASDERAANILREQ
jgi:hypothetical protein